MKLFKSSWQIMHVLDAHQQKESNLLRHLMKLLQLLLISPNLLRDKLVTCQFTNDCYEDALMTTFVYGLK